MALDPISFQTVGCPASRLRQPRIPRNCSKSSRQSPPLRSTPENFTRSAPDGSVLINHEGHKEHEGNPRGFAPLCDSVSFVVDEFTTLSAGPAGPGDERSLAH